MAKRKATRQHGRVRSLRKVGEIATKRSSENAQLEMDSIRDVDYLSEEAENDPPEATFTPEGIKNSDIDAAAMTDEEEGVEHDDIDDDDDDNDGFSIPIRPRKRFTSDEVKELESFYQAKEKPEMKDKQRFADKFHTTVSRIQIWFQNRRAKSKKTVGLSENAGNPTDQEKQASTTSKKPRGTSDKRRGQSANLAESSGTKQQKQQMTKRRRSAGEVLNTYSDAAHLQTAQSLMPPPPPPPWLPPTFSSAYNTPRDSMVRLRPMESYNRPTALLPGAPLPPFPYTQQQIPNLSTLYPSNFPLERYTLTPHPAIVNLQHTYSQERPELRESERGFVDPAETELERNVGDSQTGTAQPETDTAATTIGRRIYPFHQGPSSKL